MRPILDITLKDLVQLVRNKMTFLFLLIMPIIFTLLFGFAFGGFGSQPSEQRFPVGYLDFDQSEGSSKLTNLLSSSPVFYLEENPDRSKPDLESLVSKKALAAAVIVPVGYGETVRNGNPIPLIVISDPGNTASLTIENEISRIAGQQANVALTVQVISSTLGVDSSDSLSEEVMQAWRTPPIALRVTHSELTEQPNSASMSLAHTAPGMMLQFAIASLLTSAQILVNERKTRSLQRLMTTRVARWQILSGHFLAIFMMLLMQFTILIAFGQWVLGLDYMRLPLATVLMTLASTACLASLGLLIGTLAKTDEQAIIFSLIPMFVFAGLGGAWVPLEVTGETFRTIGHLTPVAWGMDGYKNILARGLGLESVTIPVLALIGYGVLFFTIAAWLFARREEK
jgi:ABC-2 type transport system permease protein